MSNVPNAPDETADEPMTFSTLLEAYRLGQQAARHLAAQESQEATTAAERIGARLRAAAAPHAFTVVHIDGAGIDDWLWTCTCGDQFIQLEGETIHARLIAHARGPAPESQP